MDSELIARIQRIYAALGAVEETNLEKLKATVIDTPTVVGIDFDPQGEFTEADLSNFAYSLIHNIATLRDHVRIWAAHNGQDKEKVNETMNSSLALLIVGDLSNYDKHGTLRPGDKGLSGKFPRLVEIRRVLELTAQAGSGVAMTFATDGTPRIAGSGSARAVITGDIVDKNNYILGDFLEIANEAMEAWEQLLTEFGIETQ